MKKYKNYSDDDIVKYSQEVFSIAGILKKLNLKPTGGNYANIKKHILRLKINVSHWTGKSWNKNQQLKNWKNYTKAINLKKHLIKDRGNKCECCGLVEWLGQSIKLEIHHINGDKTDNRYDNLQLLCPNCHSLTDSWRKPKLN